MPESTQVDTEPGPTTEAATRTGPVDRRALLDAMAELVLSVRSVLRLEPTIRNRLRQLSEHPVSTIGTGAPAPDGVAVKKIGGEFDVSVEIAVAPDRPAAETADEVRRRVRELILDSGLEPGSVSVSVLALERPEPVPDPIAT